jgi:hypothetical protein
MFDNTYMGDISVEQETLFWERPTSHPVIDLHKYDNTSLVTFYASNKPIITINCESGEVKVDPELSLSEASTQFWTILSQTFPGMFTQVERKQPTDKLRSDYDRAMGVFK